MPILGSGGCVNTHFNSRDYIRRGAIYWLGVVLSGFLMSCPNLLDNVPPNVTITSPANNSTVTATTATVNGTATDNTGISSLEFTLNGGTAQTISATNPFSFTTNLVVGSNAIVVTAKDAAGNAKSATLNVQRNQANTTESEPNDSKTQAQNINKNTKIVGGISSNTDTDYYKFNVTAGDWVKFDLDAQNLNPASTLDSVLEILDSQGTSLVQNNNTRNWSSGSADSFIAYKFPNPGEYILKVSSFNNSTQGAYTLTTQNKAPAWTLRSVGGNYREVNSTTRLDTSRISLELRDADNPDYGPTGTYPLVITGPSGWNNNQAFTTDTQWFGDYRDLNPPPPPDIASNPLNTNNALQFAPLMAGVYTAKLTIYGSEYTTNFNIDPSTALPIPEPVMLSNISPSSVTATWSAVSGAVRYFTVLIDTSNNSWVSYKTSNTSEAVFTGLPLSETKKYRIDVNAYRDDGIEKAFLNGISFDSSANRSTFFTATSTGPSFPLNVTKIGTGTGNISSNPSGIECGVTCNATFTTGTTVTLTATPTAGSSFAGWGGACSGTTTCTVTMDVAKTVSATFTGEPINLPSITISTPQTTLQSGSSIVLNASVSNGGTSDLGIAWGVLSGGGVLSSDTGASVSFTAPNVTSATKVQIKAALKQNPNTFVVVDLTVNPKSAVTVTVSPATTTLKTGAKLNLYATINNATVQDVTWTASSGTVTPTVASGATAEFTAPSVTTDTTVTITATSKEDATKSSSSTVTVLAPKLSLQVLWLDFRYLDAEGYTLSGTTVSIPLGGAFHLRAQKDGIAVNTPVTFTSSDTSSVMFHATNDASLALIGGIKPNSSATIQASMDGLQASLTVNVGVVQNQKPETMYPSWSGMSFLRPAGLYGFGDSSGMGIGQTSGEINPPLKLPVPATVIGGSGGYNHNLALSDTGKVYGTGAPENGTNAYQVNWVDTGISGIAAISGHYQTNYFITNDGQRRVFSNGANYSGQACQNIDVNTRTVGYGNTNALGVARVIAGRLHVMILTPTGKMYTCGSNQYGELGRGGTGNPIVGWADALRVPTVIDCTGDDGLSVCITPSRGLVVWGRQPFGQFGLGHNNTVDPPAPVPGITGVLDVKCNIEMCILRTWGGKIFGAGKLEGIGLPNPINYNWVEIPLMNQVVQIAVSEYRKLFVRNVNDQYFQLTGDRASQLSFDPPNISVDMNTTNLSFQESENPVLIATARGTSFSKVNFTSEDTSIVDVEPTYVEGHHDSAVRLHWKRSGITRVVAQSALGGTPTYITVTAAGNLPPQIKRFYVDPVGPFNFDADLHFFVEIIDPDTSALSCRISRYDNGQLDWVYPDTNGFTPCSDSTFHPSHKVTWTYGDRTYKLEVTDGKNTVSQDLVIGLKGNDSPIISSFTASSTSGTAPLSTTFNWAVSDPNGDFITCELDLDGDGVYEFKNPCSSYTSQAKTYASSGTYNAKLKVTDIRGGVTEATKTITVGAVLPPNQNPVISSFTATPSSGTAPITVDFAYTVSDPNNDALTCYLDANGDGINDQTITNCTTGSFSQAFSSNGTYNAKLQVVDGRGGAANETRVLSFASIQAPQPVALVIHGIGAFGTVEACENFEDYRLFLNNRGFEAKTVGYYADSRNCTINLSNVNQVYPLKPWVLTSGGNCQGNLGFSLNTDIRRIASRLAWYIQKLKDEGREVYIFAHSMGGLIASLAIGWNGQSRIQLCPELGEIDPEFPIYPLGNVKALTTIGTPYDGSNNLAAIGCTGVTLGSIQCDQIKPARTSNFTLQKVYESQLGFNNIRFMSIATVWKGDELTWLTNLTSFLITNKTFALLLSGLLNDQANSDTVVPASSALSSYGGVKILYGSPALTHTPIPTRPLSQTNDYSEALDAKIACSNGTDVIPRKAGPHPINLALQFFQGFVGSCTDIGQAADPSGGGGSW
jgi:pimeloyl-ACP methyl ester carboxylesterase